MIQVDYEALHASAATAQADTVDVSGQVLAWRVVSARQLEPVSEAEIGCFYTNDIYFVAHTNLAGNVTVWYWQGKGSGKAGMFMYSDALSVMLKLLKPAGKPVEMRLVEGSEPLAFVALFTGRCVALPLLQPVRWLA